MDELHDQFFERSPDLLVIAGTDGFFKKVNPAWTKLLGWSSDELLSMPYLEFVHPEDRNSTLEETCKYFCDRYHTSQFVNRYLHKDGSYVPLIWSAARYTKTRHIYAIAQEYKGSLEIFSDARRKASEARQSISYMAEGLLHEINNPLAIIKGASHIMENMIRNGDGNPERMLQLIEKISKTVDRIVTIMDDLRGYASKSNQASSSDKDLRP